MGHEFSHAASRRLADYPMDTWTAREFASRIESLGPDFKPAAASFQALNVTGRTIVLLQGPALDAYLKEEIGIASFGLRRRMVQTIEAWISQYSKVSQGNASQVQSSEITMGVQHKHRLEVVDSSANDAPNDAPAHETKRRRIAPQLIGPARSSISKPAQASQLADFSDRKENALRKGVLSPVGYRHEDDHSDGIIVEGADGLEVHEEELEEEEEEDVVQEDENEGMSPKQRESQIRDVAVGKYGQVQDHNVTEENADYRSEEDEQEADDVIVLDSDDDLYDEKRATI
ncbi:uncharacterized protein SPPG_00671 [Spizellomyces punctatus DAOM BR117]|uniref:SAM domain-containing protein n=1 Tax=Spizellomyces punctatus (strain DAOM BR117) TaxID=645134 RepID=A0A0L0HV73_SPIPD|nr:uncharacterized protein SPPG_00671 [Spizellomyces punctatus DAOM BR117]KND04987.1 hypothetical protein SPPG_00671 [Spizellomyces punctatus DAOM BR117]|eukprot:XP_016613026.1 hypothetical protein SPPG_00671 [Spizellomyces punctatus DAOM BR117]